MNDSSETPKRRYDDLRDKHIEEITQLQIIQKYQSEELRGLSTALGNLSEQFKQVKYTVFGAAGLYILQAIGVIEFIKGLLL